MSCLFHISEAAAIAIHAVLLLAKEPQKSLNAREIAEELGVSFNHTVRVLPRLRQGELLAGERGPNGGFRLAGNPREVTLLDVYEMMEGRLKDRDCLFQNPHNCYSCPVFGRLTREISSVSRKFLTETTLEIAVNQMKGDADLDKTAH